jgi:hypothetical protein
MPAGFTSYIVNAGFTVKDVKPAGISGIKRGNI